MWKKEFVFHFQSVNKKDENGQTALHKASMNGWMDCVGYLLDKGAVVNSQDVAGILLFHSFFILTTLGAPN